MKIQFIMDINYLQQKTVTDAWCFLLGNEKVSGIIWFLEPTFHKIKGCVGVQLSAGLVIFFLLFFLSEDNFLKASFRAG